MVFDFGAPTQPVASNTQQQSLLDIASTPQGEFDFDFNAGPSTSAASQPSSAPANGGEIDLIN